MKNQSLFQKRFIFIFTLLLVFSVQSVSPVAEGRVCQVGDVLSPGESCTDGTGDDFTVLGNGFGRYLFITAEGGINLQGNINGKQRNFIAEKRADGNWEIKSVTGGAVQQPDSPPTDEQEPVGTGPKVLVVDPNAPPIYWTTYKLDIDTLRSMNGGIQRVNLDGTNVEDLITTGLRTPYRIALDIVGGKMYWTDWDAFKIQRANLDGSNVQDLLTGLYFPHGIALDIAGGKMYWTDRGRDKIQRANLNGSNVEDLVTQGLKSPRGIALDVAASKMYWTDWRTKKIQRANLDGTNVEDLITSITSELDSPDDIALDVASGKMYWTHTNFDSTTHKFINGKIQRANLDGSNVQDLLTGLKFPFGIALDIAGGKMYWTDSGTVQRANLDGSNVEDLITVSRLHGIALGIPSQAIPLTPDLVIESVQAEPSTVEPGETFRLYATLKNQGRGVSTATKLRYYRSTDAVISTEDTQLSSAQRDPLAANATIRRYLPVTAPATPGTYYYGVCVDSVSDESDTANNCSITVRVTVTTPPAVSEDVNDDGVVDVQDLVYVAQRYGQTGTTTADVNDDGVVNIDDLILVAAVLDADAAAAPSLHSYPLERLTVREVQLWLSEAYQRDVTDPSVGKGILFLEQLLSVLTPKETALLANYPNPFNPETWIPYQLAKPADVTLTIYASNGQVVRRLALGHQAAGVYQSRSRAVYWDGRNAFGEPVASGLYFYTLTAGDFTATRKMLIRK